MRQPFVALAGLVAILLATSASAVDALDCYTCNSRDTAACGTLRNVTTTELPVVRCDADVTACSVRLDPQGYIVRGCERAAVEECSGDSCSRCTADKCNGVAYPVNGLQCVQCAGDECKQAQTALPCPLYEQKDSCYTAFSKDGQTVYRGCVAADRPTTGGQLCARLGSLCVKCSRNGCNTAQPIIQDNPLQCIKCDSRTDPDCAEPLAGAVAQECELIANGQVDACFVHVRNGTVERGCLSERFALELSDCTGDGSGTERCELCREAGGCNRAPLKAEVCVVCDSERDARCRDGSVQLDQAVCELSAKPMGCYRFQEPAGGVGQYGDLVKRGCVSHLDDAEAALCQRSRDGCKRCHGAACNQKPHFQTCRNCTTADDLRCFTNATATPLVECAAYTDECYTHVVANTVTRGCLAESAAPLRDDCTDPAKCRRCDDEQECNAQPVGADDFCYTCDSRTDENCRANVTDAMIEQCAFSVQALGCFRREDADGHVQRGCLNAVRNATAVADCQSQSDACKTCAEPHCNAKPAFQRCRVCDSSENSACIRSPGSFASQLCPNYMDECYTHADDDVVVRGCTSAFKTPAIRAECEAESDEFCVRCSADGASCNAQLVDGEFCYECDSERGENCARGANFTMRKQCPLAVGRRGCYLFDDAADGAGVVKRGCVADLRREERDACRQPGSETCKTCVGNDCNAKQTFQRCRYCDSRRQVNCVRAPHVMETVLCERYDDECFVHVDANSSAVTRGCLRQHAGGHAQIEADCADIAIDVCETCAMPGPQPCNQRLIDGEFCMRCDSDEDPACKGAVQNHTARVQCPLSPIVRGCYHREGADGRVQRGCLADLGAAEADECREDGAVCKSCTGDDCNRLAEFRRCRMCNSLQSVSCIRSPNAFASVVCMRYDDQCYTHVLDDVVHRGCVKDWPSPLAVKVNCGSNFTDICETCSEAHSCNNRIVDGEFCLTCDSELDAGCRSGQNYTMRTQCPLSVGGRGCYLYDDGAGLVKRGCVGDLIEDEARVCNEQDGECKTCRGNDCNQKTKFQQCRVCSSEQSVNCIRAPWAFAAQQCRHYDDDCVTHVRNGTVTRGCMREIMKTEVQADCSSTDSGAGDYCQKCQSDEGACNAATVDGEFCLTCDSATDPNCRDQLNHTMRTQCPLSPEPRGCFRLVSADGHVRRGCVADLDEPAIAECRLEGEACKTCVGNDCNAKVAFQQCRVCSSASSVSCIRSPGAFASRTCRAYTDECYTHVENDVVTRGCLAEQTTPEAVRDECRNGDGEMCESCATGANCNNRLVDGEFCLACDSGSDPECSTSTNFTMREQCPLSLGGRGCYLNYGTDGNVTRGCVAKLLAPERSECRLEGDACKTCRGNDCNAKPTFEYCRTCSSTTSVNCIRSPGAFASQLCRSYADQCYTHVRDNVVTRGCLAESSSPAEQAPPAIQSDCAADGDTEFCHKCSATARGCNNRLVDGEFCLTCDSLADANCLGNATFAMRTQCPLAVQPRGCYRHTYDNDTRVTRGCVADLDGTAELAVCQLQGAACKTCVGNDCNQQASFAGCKRCSSVTDVDCFRGPRWVESVTCPEYLDTCFLHVQNNTATRGCLSEARLEAGAIARDCGADGEFCALCKGATDCNMQQLDGEFCLHCDSETDARCSEHADWTMRKQCDLSVQRRGCYRFDDGETVKRGCVADLHADEVTLCRRQGAQCKTCTGDDCNAVQQFSICQVCNSTTAVNCVRAPWAANPQQCRAYGDECYSHAVDNVVTRGCLSAAPAAVRAACDTRPELCERCQGALCNMEAVDGEFCMECDSRTDANCRERLDHTLRVQCPLSVKRRGCYRAESDDGHVQRGCVASLDVAAVSACEADPGKCKTCAGDDCNAKPHFQHCKVCNSTENLDCIRYAAGYIDAVQCERYDDECFTHVKDDVIVRGCLKQHGGSSNETTSIRAECGNPDLCERCTGGKSAAEACNAKLIDGEFCLTCDSSTNADCRLFPAVQMHTQCSLAVAPLGCFHYAGNQSATAGVTSVVRRGCISDLSAAAKTACRADVKHCKQCRGNDCNIRPDFARCLTCDSSVDGATCADPINRAPTTPGNGLLVPDTDCLDYADECYTQLAGARVRRGCVREATHAADLRTECERDQRLCRLCRGEHCNQLNVKPETCWECDSAAQPGVDCVANLVNAKRCSPDPDYSFDRRGCFHQIAATNASAIRRGCVRHLERDEQIACAEQGAGCKTCQGDNCNERAAFQSCYKCGFLYGDENCADNTTAAMRPSACNHYDNSCATYILQSGATVRGCTRDLRNLAEVERVECAADDCNGAVYPADRLRCHQCSGAECSDEQAPEAATVCRNYRPDDRCYGYVDASNHMHRGCASDVDEQRERCTGNGTLCVQCEGNGCNGAAAFRDATLACVKCASTDACDWGHEPLAAETCKKSVPYGRNETCFTLHSSAGTIRGCSNDVAEPLASGECPEGARCERCDGPACNGANQVWQVCQVCNSSLAGQAACAEKDLLGFAEQCPAMRFDQRGCFTRNDGGEITRGCMLALDDDKRDQCTGGEHPTICEVCLQQDCNTKQPPSSAIAMASVSLLLVLFAVTVSVLLQTMV